MAVEQNDVEIRDKFIELITVGDPKDKTIRSLAWEYYVAANGFGLEELNEIDKKILRTVAVERRVGVTANELTGNIVDTRIDVANIRLLHRLDPRLKDNINARNFMTEMWRDIQPR